MYLSVQETWVRSLVSEDPTCLRATEPSALQLLSLCSRVWEPQLLKPAHLRVSALQQEKPLQWEARALQLEYSPRLPQLEKSPHSNSEPAQPKINKIYIYIYKNTAILLDPAQIPSPEWSLHLPIQMWSESVACLLWPLWKNVYTSLRKGLPQLLRW